MTNQDQTMEAIAAAVTEGAQGDVDSARTKLLQLWRAIGVDGDPLYRCTLAHYLADLYEHPAQALVWDVRALDAADAATEERVQAQDANLHLAGFYPSLHLNIADAYRRLGCFDTAAEHIEAAREHASALPEDGYGAMIRHGIEGVAEAIRERSTVKRPSAPAAASPAGG